MGCGGRSPLPSGQDHGDSLVLIPNSDEDTEEYSSRVTLGHVTEAWQGQEWGLLWGQLPSGGLPGERWHRDLCRAQPVPRGARAPRHSQGFSETDSMLRPDVILS